MTTRIDPLTPAGTVVVCCHHEVLVEILTAPAGERSAYIDAHKPEHERATRHFAFRALTTWERLPAPVLGAYRAWVDAYLARVEAYRACVKADLARAEAGRAWVKAERAQAEAYRAWAEAYRAWAEAERAWVAALRTHWADVVAVVRAEHPDLPVDWATGHLILPEAA